MNQPTDFKKGDRVLVGCENWSDVPGEILLASANGYSLIVHFREGMFAGYVEAMPLFFNGGAYYDLFLGRPVTIQKHT